MQMNKEEIEWRTVVKGSCALLSAGDRELNNIIDKRKLDNMLHKQCGEYSYYCSADLYQIDSSTFEASQAAFKRRDIRV
jgi:hypothetical protein